MKSKQTAVRGPTGGSRPQLKPLEAGGSVANPTAAAGLFKMHISAAASATLHVKSELSYPTTQHHITAVAKIFISYSYIWDTVCMTHLHLN